VHAATPSRDPNLPAGLLLTLAAAAYDALLVAAILFIAAAAAIVGNGGEAIAPGNVWFNIYLLVAAFPYFGWCWTHSGQTLGMKTWRIVLNRADGKPVRVPAVAVRYVFAMLSWAAFMLGFLWMLADARQRSWHDIVSGTRLIRVNESG
jgi:uncharacterized RDD family membrane protein YckC